MKIDTFKATFNGVGKKEGNMRIGLIDVDGHNFPNLPLMKLSAYYKKQGYEVEWYDPLFGGIYDVVYMSKVFSFTPDYEYPINARNVIRGGVDIV